MGTTTPIVILNPIAELDNAFNRLSLFAVQYGFDRRSLDVDGNALCGANLGVISLDLTCGTGTGTGASAGIAWLNDNNHNDVECIERTTTSGTLQCSFTDNSFGTTETVIMVACAATDDDVLSSSSSSSLSLQVTSSRLETECSSFVGQDISVGLSHSMTVGHLCFSDNNSSFVVSSNCVTGDLFSGMGNVNVGGGVSLVTDDDDDVVNFCAIGGGTTNDDVFTIGVDSLIVKDEAPAECTQTKTTTTESFDIDQEAFVEVLRSNLIVPDYGTKAHEQVLRSGIDV